MPLTPRPRSLLFAPGGDERKARRALDAGADVVVLDLEDAVAAAEKPAARELTSRLLSELETASLRVVRINAAGTEWFADDVAAVAALGLDAVVLPKSSPDAVEALRDAGLPDGLPVLAIVETAQGLRLSYETACAPPVAHLILGAVDLGLELGLETRPDGQEILFARSKLVMDSIAAGIGPPIDVVHVNTRDDEGLEAAARLARSLGFRAKACIHPAQLAVVHRVFSPSEDELARARAVVEAYERAEAEGRGAVALEGEMIDWPVVERARTVLADAERSEG